MECLYKTTTKYSYEEYKKFNNAIMMKKQVWLILVLALIMILLGGILLQSTFLVIFAVIYPFLFLMVKNFNVKKVFNSNKLAKDTDVIFEFYEDHFEEHNESGNASIPYDKLDQIIETKTNFYLMIAKNQGFMLSKENMPDGLEDFIKSHMKK